MGFQSRGGEEASTPACLRSPLPGPARRFGDARERLRAMRQPTIVRSEASIRCLLHAPRLCPCLRALAGKYPEPAAVIHGPLPMLGVGGARGPVVIPPTGSGVRRSG